jgi:hypothetical protein
VIRRAAGGLRQLGLIPYRSSPLVFGLGLSKTGTTSLGAALKLLGYRHKSYDLELLERWSAGRVDDVFRGMAGYGSFEDWPYPLMHDEIMRRFGRSARYVLTVRSSPEVWLESLKGHAMRAPPDRARYRAMAYGYAYPHLDESAHIEFYNRHIVAVRAAAARHGVTDLLVEVCWELNHGWAELCPLLGLTPPRVSFPHANRAKANPAHLGANRLKLAQLAGEGGADPAAIPAP